MKELVVLVQDGGVGEEGGEVEGEEEHQEDDETFAGID